MSENTTSAKTLSVLLVILCGVTIYWGYNMMGVGAVGIVPGLMVWNMSAILLVGASVVHAVSLPRLIMKTGKAESRGKEADSDGG